MLTLFDVQPERPSANAREDTPSRARKIEGRNLPVSDVLLDAERVLFLDVETTGLSWFYDQITIVGWAINGTYKVLLRGQNADPLLHDLAAADVLVTFNGTLFDLRFLRKEFGDIALPRAHIDLRYLSKRAGLTGGQKAIERELGIKLREGSEDVDGAAAVLLWHEYLRGSNAALRSLIQYNRSDVLAMGAILDWAMEKIDAQPHLWLQRPCFGQAALAISALPFDLPVIGAGSSRRSFRTFKGVFSGTAAENATVVGIDLTGSEKRASGWCVLRGDQAETDSVFTDQEMVERILSERPSLVSIDSPLSLPFGRNTVSDDDPARDEFGIMRRCERELKRRGINVYPSLLPSMQGLTKRGILLAERLRSQGVPVIESYPGAAQDIMGIPRKGAGIEYLKRGLSEFGVVGRFVDNSVSHDELDAITSSLVGSFFLAGKYEALRGPTEGALIIPDLGANDRDAMIVGISGRICAGKTTVAHMLEQLGFAYSRFSMVIDDQILAANGLPNRETRQRVGDEINRDKGQRWLCEKVMERVPGKSLVVIDGLRFPEDHAFFVETFGARFVHLHIVADTAVRNARYDLSSPGEVGFAAADAQRVESKIDELAALASATIENNGTLDQLNAAVMRELNSRGLKEVGCRSQSS